MNPGRFMRTGDLEVDIEVDGEAATADVVCDQTRLDQGGVYAYDFRAVEVRRTESPVQPYSLFYQARWLGEGAAGPVTWS
jgi:hypothetical protein